MAFNLASIAIGLLLLVWASEKFVEGSSGIARHFGVPLFFIGFLVVGIGTSSPEMFVSALASLDGNTGLAIGNVIGSNISNIALVLGATALISPIIVERSEIRVQLPLLFIFSTVTYYLMIDGLATYYDSMLMITCMVFTLYLLVRMTPKDVIYESNAEKLAEEGIEVPDELPIIQAVIFTLLGMVFLYFGSKLLTSGAIGVAREFGVSDLVIGLTVVAIGTSLPELSASIMAAFKKKHDLALGNIIGSNVFNTLFVLAIPGFLAPGEVPQEAISRDFTISLIITLLLIFYCNHRIKLFKTSGVTPTGDKIEAISRKEGYLLVTLFIAYQIYVYTSSTL